MTKDEALKLALKALETSMYPQQKQLQAITAIKEALAQPEQEPVAWHTEDHLTDRSATTYSKDMAYRWQCKGWPVTPLYTTPPQRTWVGLTKEEKEKIKASWIDITLHYANISELMDTIEQSLKDKNT